MRKMTALAPFVVAALSLVSLACSTNTVGLAYAPTTAPPAAAAATPAAKVSVGDFTDNRHEPVRWIGAIRGGFGNPLKTLETDKPVSDLVKEAFRKALAARGLFAEDGQYVVSGWIDKLDGDQYSRKEATADFKVAVTNRQTHSEVLNRPTSANEVAGSAVTMKSGIFGSTEELRALIERVMNQAIDKFLDSSAFQEAIRR